MEAGPPWCITQKLVLPIRHLSPFRTPLVADDDGRIHLRVSMCASCRRGNASQIGVRWQYCPPTLRRSASISTSKIPRTNALSLSTFPTFSSETLLRSPSHYPLSVPHSISQRNSSAHLSSTMPASKKDFPSAQLQRYLVESRAQGSVAPFTATMEGSATKREEMKGFLAAWGEHWKRMADDGNVHANSDAFLPDL